MVCTHNLMQCCPTPHRRRTPWNHCTLVRQATVTTTTIHGTLPHTPARAPAHTVDVGGRLQMPNAGGYALRMPRQMPSDAALWVASAARLNVRGGLDWRSRAGRTLAPSATSGRCVIHPWKPGPQAFCSGRDLRTWPPPTTAPSWTPHDHHHCLGHTCSPPPPVQRRGRHGWPSWEPPAARSSLSDFTWLLCGCPIR